jgi:hypothetical protein
MKHESTLSFHFPLLPSACLVQLSKLSRYFLFSSLELFVNVVDVFRETVVQADFFDLEVRRGVFCVFAGG